MVASSPSGTPGQPDSQTEQGGRLPIDDAKKSNKAGVTCIHCKLPVPAGLVKPDDGDKQFCCHGCRTAYKILSGVGLDAFYPMQKAAGGEGVPVRSSGAGFEQYDDPAYHKPYVTARPDGSLETEFLLEGVHCAACVWVIERLPEMVPGVIDARLSFRRSIVTLIWNPEKTDLSAIAKALDAIGYTPHPARGTDAEKARVKADRKMLINLGVAFALMGNVMLLAFALYGGAFSGMEPIFKTTFRWLSLVLWLASLIWPGRVFFQGAITSLRVRTPHLDLPIAIALAVGGAASTWNTITGMGEIYFDSLTMLVFLLLVGRLITHRQQRRASAAVELLFTMTPTTARLFVDGRSRIVPVEALRLGDEVEVLAGESFPVDGAITDGSTRVDASLLTGESRPTAVGVHESVAAGTTNLASPVRVRVEATGENARMGKLMRLVEEAAERRAPIVKFADRIAVWFVLAVLSLAAITFGIWIRSSLHEAIEFTTALLIVACPCALGLATPLVMTVATGRAARRGVLVKGADTIERLARPGTLLLDKTGTVTHGRAAVLEWSGDESLKPLAAALERKSTHPIAAAIAELDDDPGWVGSPSRQDQVPGWVGSPSRHSVDRVDQTTGGGVRGVVDGRAIALGSGAYMQTLGIAVESWAHDKVEQIASNGSTPVLVAEGDAVAAVVAVGDAIRHDSAEAIEHLRAQGWQVELLSGDHPQTVAATGAQLGLAPEHCRGGATPEDKLARVEALRAASGSERSSESADTHPARSHSRLVPKIPVVMVGDGVNDAAALAAADVGIAVHGGAEASLEAADIYLSTPGLSPILGLLGAARSAMGSIHLCLGVSLVYNAVAASLAMAGLIHPIVAAILMPLSSLSVLAIALRSGRKAAP